MKPKSDFWSHVNKNAPNGCWEWTANTRPNGYGRYLNEAAHRYSYKLAYGSIPDGAVIMHTCDNHRCVNPAHLRAGTYKENTQDMIRKDRHSRGEKRWSAKLTQAQVDEIRRRKANGETGPALAKEFGVSHEMIYNIANCRNWKHLPCR